MRIGLIDSSIGTAGKVGEGDARSDADQSGNVPLAESSSPAR
jgi:hypothetical protein